MTFNTQCNLIFFGLAAAIVNRCFMGGMADERVLKMAFDTQRNGVSFDLVAAIVKCCFMDGMADDACLTEQSSQYDAKLSAYAGSYGLLVGFNRH